MLVLSSVGAFCVLGKTRCVGSVVLVSTIVLVWVVVLYIVDSCGLSVLLFWACGKLKRFVTNWLEPQTLVPKGVQ